jgi:hypothetical protein
MFLTDLVDSLFDAVDSRLFIIFSCIDGQSPS